jgi:succinate dehydrogenase hydrophobic anchor subunit
MAMRSIVLAGVFLTVVLAYGAIALVVNAWLCPLVFTFTVLTVLIFMLAEFGRTGILRDKSIVEALRIVIKAIPTFIGKTPHQGRVEP